MLSSNQYDEGNHRISCVRISPCTKKLAVGNEVGECLVFDITDIQMSHVIASHLDHKGYAISSLCWSNDSSTLFSGCSIGKVIEWHISDIVSDKVTRNSFDWKSMLGLRTGHLLATLDLEITQLKYSISFENIGYYLLVSSGNQTILYLLETSTSNGVYNSAIIRTIRISSSNREYYDLSSSTAIFNETNYIASSFFSCRKSMISPGMLELLLCDIEGKSSQEFTLKPISASGLLSRHMSPSLNKNGLVEASNIQCGFRSMYVSENALLKHLIFSISEKHKLYVINILEMTIQYLPLFGNIQVVSLALSNDKLLVFWKYDDSDDSRVFLDLFQLVNSHEDKTGAILVYNVSLHRCFAKIQKFWLKSYSEEVEVTWKAINKSPKSMTSFRLKFPRESIGSTYRRIHNYVKTALLMDSHDVLSNEEMNEEFEHIEQYLNNSIQLADAEMESIIFHDHGTLLTENQQILGWTIDEVAFYGLPITTDKQGRVKSISEDILTQLKDLNACVSNNDIDADHIQRDRKVSLTELTNILDFQDVSTNQIDMLDVFLDDDSLVGVTIDDVVDNSGMSPNKRRSANFNFDININEQVIKELCNAVDDTLELSSEVLKFEDFEKSNNKEDKLLLDVDVLVASVDFEIANTQSILKDGYYTHLANSDEVIQLIDSIQSDVLYHVNTLNSSLDLPLLSEDFVDPSNSLNKEEVIKVDESRVTNDEHERYTIDEDSYDENSWLHDSESGCWLECYWWTEKLNPVKNRIINYEHLTLSSLSVHNPVVSFQQSNDEFTHDYEETVLISESFQHVDETSRIHLKLSYPSKVSKRKSEIVDSNDEVFVDVFPPNIYRITLFCPTGLGVKLAITQDEHIYIQAFRRLSNGNRGPAELSEVIEIGDELISINDIHFCGLGMTNIVHMLNPQNFIKCFGSYNLQMMLKKADRSVSFAAVPEESQHQYQHQSQHQSQLLHVTTNPLLNIFAPVIHSHERIRSEMTSILSLVIPSLNHFYQSSDYEILTNAQLIELYRIDQWKRHCYPGALILAAISPSNIIPYKSFQDSINGWDVQILDMNELLEQLWSWRAMIYGTNHLGFFINSTKTFCRGLRTKVDIGVYESLPFEDEKVTRFALHKHHNSSTRSFNQLEVTKGIEKLQEVYHETSLASRELVSKRFSFLYLTIDREESSNSYNRVVSSYKSLMNKEFTFSEVYELLVFETENQNSYFPQMMSKSNRLQVQSPKIPTSSTLGIYLPPFEISMILFHYLKALFTTRKSDSLKETGNTSILLDTWMELFIPLEATKRSQLRQELSYEYAREHGFSSMQEMTLYIRRVCILILVYFALNSLNHQTICIIIETIQDLEGLSLELDTCLHESSNELKHCRWNDIESTTFLQQFFSYLDPDFILRVCSIRDCDIDRSRTIISLLDLVAKDPILSISLDITRKYVSMSLSFNRETIYPTARVMIKGIKAMANSDVGSFYCGVYCFLSDIFHLDAKLASDISVLSFPYISPMRVKSILFSNQSLLDECPNTTSRRIYQYYLSSLIRKHGLENHVVLVTEWLEVLAIIWKSTQLDLIQDEIDVYKNDKVSIRPTLTFSFEGLGGYRVPLGTSPTATTSFLIHRINEIIENEDNIYRYSSYDVAKLCFRYELYDCYIKCLRGMINNLLFHQSLDEQVSHSIFEMNHYLYRKYINEILDKLVEIHIQKLSKLELSSKLIQMDEIATRLGSCIEIEWMMKNNISAMHVIFKCWEEIVDIKMNQNVLNIDFKRYGYNLLGNILVSFLKKKVTLEMLLSLNKDIQNSFTIEFYQYLAAHR